MATGNPVIDAVNRVSLVKQIIIGLLFGIFLGYLTNKDVGVLPDSAVPVLSILGSMFVGALKAIAPILVFVLVTAAIASHQKGREAHVKPILLLYLIGTFSAAIVAIIASFMFPSELVLAQKEVSTLPPAGIAEVLKTLLLNLVANPINAIANANYIGILMWALLMGFALRHAVETTRILIADLAAAISKIVGWVIRFAPLGIFGLVAEMVATSGIKGLISYLHVLAVLILCMLFVTFVINPIIVWWKIRRNPFPLVLTCLQESGITAFFTRSSAANIPVNMALCKKLDLHEDTYSVAIPLGATINMAGAAITITVLSLAAAHTQGIHIDFMTALLLSLTATISACGASGVAGGSLLLVPLACNLLGISNDVAMQVVGVGFTIGVIQDSCETALNSSTDVLFTAAADIGRRRTGHL